MKTSKIIIGRVQPHNFPKYLGNMRPVSGAYIRRDVTRNRKTGHLRIEGLACLRGDPAYEDKLHRHLKGLHDFIDVWWKGYEDTKPDRRGVFMGGSSCFSIKYIELNSFDKLLEIVSEERVRQLLTRAAEDYNYFSQLP